jgi:hypothetical protein
MSQSFKKLILDYCGRHSIAVPVGFGRNTPSRYAVIRTDLSPAKLVATTWFKQEDVAYYFERVLVPQIGSEVAASIPVLDFKEGRSLRFAGSTRLAAAGEIS